MRNMLLTRGSNLVNLSQKILNNKFIYVSKKKFSSEIKDSKISLMFPGQVI